MDKENITDVVKQLTASERVQFIELLNEYTLADKIGTNTEAGEAEISKNEGKEPSATTMQRKFQYDNYIRPYGDIPRDNDMIREGMNLGKKARIGQQ